MKSRSENSRKPESRTVAAVLIAVALIAASCVIRYRGLNFVSWDMKGFGLVWYDYISEHGLWNSLRDPFSNYTPPYLYLIGLATLTKSFLSRILAIKAISLVCDVFNAWIIYRIVGLKYDKPHIPIIAGSVAFILPTAVLNSAYWGQVDALYTAFLLTCLYFLLRDRPGWGIFFFSVGMSIKLQAFFLLPFLVVLTFRKKIAWKYYLLIPLVYLILVLPAALAGRPLLDLLTIYLQQADNTNLMSRNAGNPYIFMPVTGQIRIFSYVIDFPPYLIYLLLLAVALTIALWIFLTVKRTALEKPGQLLLAALASLSLMPYILPRMHDRYFYPADIFSLVVAFYIPRLWFLPILFQIGSCLVYDNYFFGTKYRYLEFALLANSIALAFILWNQLRKTKSPAAARGAA